MKEIWNNKIRPGLLWFFKSFIWLGVLLLVIDIVTKNVVVANKDYIRDLMIKNGNGIILIPNFLAISYVINTGAAFGLSSGNVDVNRAVYIVIASIISIAIILFFIWKFKKINKFYRATIMLILVGAIGNLIDRIFYSPSYLGSTSNGVVDWINFFGVWKYNFNIADSCIVVGVFMLIIYLIVEEVKEGKAKKMNVKMANDAEKKEVNAEVAKVEDVASSDNEPIKEEKTEPVIKEKKEHSTKKVTKKNSK